MKKILIKNFGPIENFEMDIKKINIFIGPQAGGKSTIAKSIFLVENIKMELLEHIRNIENEDENIHLLKYFNKKLKNRFVSLFGTTKHMDNFEIKYILNTDKWLKFYLDNGYVKIYYSRKLKEEIENLKNDIEKIINLNKDLKLNPLKEEILTKRFYFYSVIKNQINKIFEEESFIEYIPAGRALLSVLAEQIGNIDINQLDYVTKKYISNILNLRKLFSDDIFTIIENFKKFETEKIDFAKIDIVIKKIQNILKGNYKFESGEEKIYFDDKRYVKINFASSGQQESLWILNLIFHHILFNRPTTLIIEEPEAHLYPNAQKEIVELMSVFANKNNNKLIVTTHSPYILSAFNNLIYANKLDKKNIKIDFINKNEFINYKEVNAFFISQDKIYTILDKEIEQIKVEKIDEVSDIINKEYQKLLELEYSNEI